MIKGRGSSLHNEGLIQIQDVQDLFLGQQIIQCHIADSPFDIVFLMVPNFWLQKIHLGLVYIDIRT
jgi:hypothetical protein